MDEKEYFVIYANYSLVDHSLKHVKFLKEHSIRQVSGEEYTISSPFLRRVLNEDGATEIRQRHLMLQKVLTQIADGTPLSKIDDLRNITKETEMNKLETTITLTTDAKGNEIFTHEDSIEPISYKTQHERLHILACHSLISFLSVKGNLQKIKRCPHCKLFFIAKDTKRIICYEDKCGREHKRLHKQKQRNDDPGKYL